MQHITKVEDALAWCRFKGGVHKQVDVFQRGDKFYIPHRGGFIRICERFDGKWLTADASVTVLEIEGIEL